jgi:hypothetical protein
MCAGRRAWWTISTSLALQRRVMGNLGGQSASAMALSPLHTHVPGLCAIFFSFVVPTTLLASKTKYDVVASFPLRRVPYRISSSKLDITALSKLHPYPRPMADVVKIMPRSILPRIVLHSNPCFGICGAECVKLLARHKHLYLYKCIRKRCRPILVSIA